MSEKKPTDIELDMIESRLEEANAGKNIRATAMDTATLKGLLEKATKGPWACFYKHKYNEWHVSLPMDGSSMMMALNGDGIQTDHPEADAKLIAALRNNAEELIASAERVARLEAALRMTEFGFNHRRCPVCAGFNVGPNGETDKVHTKTCPVGQALGGAKLYAAPSREIATEAEPALSAEQIERWKQRMNDLQAIGVAMPPGSNVLADMALSSLTARDEGIEATAKLYRRAFNCAAALTNYCEDRPGLKKVEKEMAEIEDAFRALKGQP